MLNIYRIAYGVTVVLFLVNVFQANPSACG